MRQLTPFQSAVQDMSQQDLQLALVDLFSILPRSTLTELCAHQGRWTLARLARLYASQEQT